MCLPKALYLSVEHKLDYSLGGCSTVYNEERELSSSSSDCDKCWGLGSWRFPGTAKWAWSNHRTGPSQPRLLFLPSPESQNWS